MARIERATLADVPDVKRVLSETWTATYGSFLSAEAIQQVTSVWHAPDRLARQAGNPQVFLGVARLDGPSIVGMVTVRHRDTGTVMVDRLYVLPIHQRQGVGDALLRAGLAAFPGSRRARLDVEEQNRIGRTFWQKQGSSEVGRRVERVAGAVLEMVEMEKAPV
ncbi:MAG TPA: N-acetyltransferase [Methylomirabilota bacterium]|nr:N-acetyltransferase [Methylomirabilota bacterium]